MSPLRRPPPNVEYPAEITCKWCGSVRQNHCYRRIKTREGIEERRNKGCSWYPCRECQVVTSLHQLHRTDEGRWAWNQKWRRVPKSWFA